jgi:hypothetical protein
MEGGDKNTLLEFYIDPYKNYDTIIAIKNCPPLSVRNLIHVKKYQNQCIYIYYTEGLEPLVSKFINITDEPVKAVNLKPLPNEFECIFTKTFVFKKNQFIPDSQ